MRLLVVEDEPKLGQFLASSLKRDGFAVDLAETLDGSGLDFLKARKSEIDQPPVIILTAADSIRDRVDGLNAGADDYLGKPFAHEELLARSGNLRNLTFDYRFKYHGTLMTATCSPPRINSAAFKAAVRLL